MAGQAERAALVAACERRGLVAQETGTGGGCTAIQVTVAGREWPQVLVTNGDAMVPWFFDGDNEVLAGVFVDVDDSEGTLFVDTTVAAAGVAGLADRVAAALYTAATGGDVVDVFNPRAAALRDGVALGQYEDHEAGCAFGDGTGPACTCGESR